VPEHYLRNPDPNDPIAMEWRRAADAVVNNYKALDCLRELIAQKVAKADRLFN
jgi:hypothetical protein